jgi:hypothetical protein
VHSLWELFERLQAADTPLGWGTAIGGYSSSSEDEGSGSDSEGDRPGAPPPGVGFLDFLFVSGAVKGARCSFPRVQVSGGHAECLGDGAKQSEPHQPGPSCCTCGLFSLAPPYLILSYAEPCCNVLPCLAFLRDQLTRGRPGATLWAAALTTRLALLNKYACLSRPSNRALATCMSLKFP